MKPMLAKSYTNQNPTDWLMSEKLDGVRAIWTGEKFVSRNGKEFNAPSWFVESMPTGVILDGELTGGRGNFQTTAGKIRSKSSQWDGITYAVFDCVNDMAFVSRLGAVNDMCLPSHCEVVEHIVCEGVEHLTTFEAGILNGNGEGVMLRRADSLYVNKRSSDLLKVKRYSSDEAVVVGYQPGEGKHVGKMGALLMKHTDGREFKIGTGFDDATRDTPPVLGSVVTYSYFGLTDSGQPRHAAYTDVRDYE